DTRRAFHRRPAACAGAREHVAARGPRVPLAFQRRRILFRRPCHSRPARAASQRALGRTAAGMRLSQVVWLRPLIADGAVDTVITLQRRDAASLRFEIARVTHDARSVLCQGLAETFDGASPTLD